MKRFCQLALSVGMVLIGTHASAHHSTANFDYTKTVVLKGTVKQFQWTNPHSFIQVVVQDGNGADVEWSIESGSPALERRLGWKPEMIKPGDKVVVVIAPVLSGGPSGTLRQITLPNGKVLYGPGNQGEVPGLPTLPSVTEEGTK
jgi:hypothetical protein